MNISRHPILTVPCNTGCSLGSCGNTLELKYGFVEPENVPFERSNVRNFSWCLGASYFYAMYVSLAHAKVDSWPEAIIPILWNFGFAIAVWIACSGKNWALVEFLVSETVWATSMLPPKVFVRQDISCGGAFVANKKRSGLLWLCENGGDKKPIFGEVCKKPS